jgi:hypothetical protein
VMMMRKILSFIVLTRASGFVRDSRSSSTAASAFPLQKHENRPDLGRSVALLAQRHPKCPFQVVRQHVRAFLMNAPVVLEY